MTDRPTIHFINGIRDDGRETTQVLARICARNNFVVRAHEMPITHTWNAISKRDTLLLAAAILPEMKPGDHIVAHSHGCGVTMAILRRLAKVLSSSYVGGIVMLSPALDRKQNFEGLPFEKLLCIHNPADIAVMMGSLIPCHPFGLAGSHGFVTQDDRVRNEARLSFVGPWNHTAAYFQMPYVEDVAVRVMAYLWGQGCGCPAYG